MAKANGQKNHERDDQNGRKNSQVVVVMVPLPAQGHLNQLLQLSRLISSYNTISVHFVGSSIHNRQAKLRVHGFDPTTISNIQFHDFQIPSFESPPPNPYSQIKFPCHLQPSFDASRHLRKPVAALLGRLSSVSRRVVVIHDSLMASVVQDFVSFPNVESYAFRSISAFSSFWFFWDVIIGRQKSLHNYYYYYYNHNHDDGGDDYDVIVQQKDIPTLEACFTEEFEKFMNSQQEFLKFSSGNLYNSSRVIESKFLDLLEKDPIFKRNKKKKIWAIGPLNPVQVVNNTHQERKFCLVWLDKQRPKSVLFVSFGTTTSLTDEQIKELAIGLETSGVKFIWALREADKGDIFTTGGKKNNDCDQQLPKGFEERVKNRGIIVRDWAPQLEILKHSSTGGFISHCGWNSCMESITNGVPIAAWPMHSDQPRNSVLITKVLKVGIVLKEWCSPPAAAKDGGDGVVVKSSAIESAVKLLMESKEGAEVRRRAEELGISVRKSVEEGGVTRKEMDLFVAHITRC